MSYFLKNNLINSRKLFLKNLSFNFDILNKNGFLHMVYSTKVIPKIDILENDLVNKNKKIFNLTYSNKNQNDKFKVYFNNNLTNVSKLDNLNTLSYNDASKYLNKNLTNNYLNLSKYKLTGLVVTTTLAGYYMGYTNFDLSLIAFTLLGTTLTSSSAAALNQFLETPYDSQMLRTKSRPLIRHSVTPLHAFTFATICGLSGISLLAIKVNYLTAFLGALNLILYSFIYTPLKRIHIVNTWVGSIVGAIPPIMGYTASTNCIDLAGLSLGLILYSWQFPHFNALSWNMKQDYARAGYHMMVVTNPDLCVQTAFRHSFLILFYCELMPNIFNLTSKTFAFDSLPLNLYLIYLAWKFKQNPDSKTSRTLFKFSLIHLPFLIFLMLISKKDKYLESKSEQNLE